MSTRKKVLIIVAVVVVGAAVIAANLFLRRDTGVQVTTEAIRARDLEALVSASGKVQPKRRVNISANRPGRVTRLAVNEGQRVKAGQFLLEIDPRSGAMLKRHALPDDMSSLSLRHMALAPDGETIAFGMQDQDRSTARSSAKRSSASIAIPRSVRSSWMRTAFRPDTRCRRSSGATLISISTHRMRSCAVSMGNPRRRS